MMNCIRRHSTSLLLAGASLAVLATPVQAQTAAEEESTLGEILVTANKREENLQETPLAISAVSSKDLELRGLTEMKDLSAIAPNVSIIGGTTNATASVVSIRGIPSPADETQGYDSPIGMYLDGVYLARSSASSFEVADIERVEVLRGPQGTLFGRNTTGGAINFITKLPDDEMSLKVRLGVGNYGQKLGRLVLNTGVLGEKLRMSFGALHKERNGIVDNLLQPKKSLDPGGAEVDSFRFAATLELTDNLKLISITDWTRVDGVPHPAQISAVGDGVPRANFTIDGNTFNAVQPANVAGYLAASTVLEPGCDKTVTRAYRDSLCLESAGRSTDKIWGNLFRAELELEGVMIRSSTAFRRWKNHIRGSDLDGLGSLRGPLFSQASLLNGMPAGLLQFVLPPAQQAFAPFIAASPVPTVTQPLFQAKNYRSQRQFSQEVEFVSTGDGPFQWVVGAFYFKESGYEKNDQSFGFVLDTNAAVFSQFGPLSSSFQAANPARYRVVPQRSTLGYFVGGNSKAIYGQASYRPGGQDAPLGITLGLRYSWDKKSVNRFQNGGVPYTAAADIAFNQGKAKFSAPSGHLTVDYRASEDVNLYGRVARGYRSGGYNLRQATHDGAAAVPPFGNRSLPLTPFNEETIWSYELGAKTEFMDRVRLNLAVFHNVYTDQLATVPVPIVGSGSFGTITVNAGKTTYTGAELEGRIKVTDNFTLDGNLGYIKVKVKEFPGTDSTNTVRNIASVLEQGYAPKWTAAAAANYVYPIDDDTRLTARVGWNYTASYQMFPNKITAPFRDNTRGDARGLWDAQLKLDGLGIGGGTGMSVTLWGKNITNRHYVTRSVDFGQLGFAHVIYGDPRTYGLTLDFAF